MPSIDLTEQEWQSVINCMGYAPGNQCIPLINKIAAQLQLKGAHDAGGRFDGKKRNDIRAEG